MQLTFHCIRSKISGFETLSTCFSPTAKATELTLSGKWSVEITPWVHGHPSPNVHPSSCKQKRNVELHGWEQLELQQFPSHSFKSRCLYSCAIICT